jgi:hypothetical protein
MGEPLIVVSTPQVKHGRLEDVTRYYKKILELIEANEPQLIAFLGFLRGRFTPVAALVWPVGPAPIRVCSPGL